MAIGKSLVISPELLHPVACHSAPQGTWVESGLEIMWEMTLWCRYIRYIYIYIDIDTIYGIYHVIDTIYIYIIYINMPHIDFIL